MINNNFGHSYNVPDNENKRGFVWIHQNPGYVNTPNKNSFLTSCEL